MKYQEYETPLASRYASPQMLQIFSPFNKILIWRKLWVCLAHSQMILGLPITRDQIDEMNAHLEDIDFDKADAYEREFHHDVMAHIHAFGDVCPNARPIIHLGSTSCYVTDNGDLIQIKEAFKLLQGKMLQVIQDFANFAKTYSHLPCLGFTHFQPAQLTTVGKRACLWLQDLVLDYQEWDYRYDNLKFLGVKGTTGTQASFLALFNKDHSKVQALDHLVATKMGFKDVFLISGQTYTRKQDIYILQALASFAAGAHKFATDLRLLANLRELEEPFGKQQIGSSAMPYKRNPMLSERICSLARFVISLSENASYTAATQWLERTLDDSANRRLSIPEAFLACDAILNILSKIIAGLVVNPKKIEKHIHEYLPYMATENILMAAVQKGGDRQTIHEKLRQYSLAAQKEDRPQLLLESVQNDESFKLSPEELNTIMKIEDFIGRSKEQVVEFLETEVSPLLEKGRKKYAEKKGGAE